MNTNLYTMDFDANMAASEVDMEEEAFCAWIDRIGRVEYIDDQKFDDFGGDTVNPYFNRSLWTHSVIL